MTATLLTLLPVPIPRAEPELPALTHLGVYDLARLFHTDRELALQLATLEGKRHDADRSR